jgi:hypothetical protein
MNNDPFDSSAPERFFPASMVTEGVQENRHSIEGLADRIISLEQASMFHKPCQGARAGQDIAQIRERTRNLEFVFYAVTAAMVIVMGLLTAGTVWVVMDSDDRVDQVEKRMRSIE